MDTLEDLWAVERALVFGVGGSGDIVGSIPTARLLESHGVDVLLGGMAWEPVPRDTRAGLRSLDELRDADRLANHVALVTGETRTADGLQFKESTVADHYDRPVALLGMDGGPVGLRRSLAAVCADRGIEAVVGVDAGGDVLAAGSEPGIWSPVTDGYGLAALADLDLASCLGVVGYGSDGELTVAEIEAALSRISAADGRMGAWGLTPRVRRELETLLERVDTTASRLPVEAARGDLGGRTIRGGEVDLELRAPASVTFYVDPAVVADQSDIAARVQGTESLDEATAALREGGYTTEFDVGASRLKAREG